jgi:hypothetical protein
MVVLGLVVEGMLVEIGDVVVTTVESDVPEAQKTLLEYVREATVTRHNSECYKSIVRHQGLVS